MKKKAGIQADVRSDSWQCGGNSGSVWIKRPYRACGPQPPGDSELHRQFWKCTTVGSYILYRCLNAAAVGGSLGDTARRCKGPCWVGGAGFPPSMFRHTHSTSTLGGGMVVRAVSHSPWMHPEILGGEGVPPPFYPWEIGFRGSRSCPSFSSTLLGASLSVPVYQLSPGNLAGQDAWVEGGEGLRSLNAIMKPSYHSQMAQAEACVEAGKRQTKPGW